jgi:hypothetical protein
MMMKKVLILLMVLGFSSLASATTLTWDLDSVDVSVDGIVNVTISADDNLSYDPKWVGASGSTIAEVIAISARPAAGTDAAIFDDRATYPGWWRVQAADTTGTPGDTIQSGIQWDVTIKGLAIGSDTLYADGDSLTVVVPEPITIALLGLGGLLLRRRK